MGGRPGKRAGSGKSDRGKTSSREPRLASRLKRPREVDRAGEADGTRLARERDEALAQLSALSEIFRLIGSSSGDTEPVFDAVLKYATQLCQAKFGNLFLWEGEAFRMVALHGAPAGWAEHMRQHPVIRPHPDSALAVSARTRELCQIADFTLEKGYRDKDPRFVALVELAGARTVLTVPLMHGDELLGAIAIYRQEVRPFNEQQVELIKDFAAQAVIAIENARLLDQLRQPSTDLTEALEQQTATSEVLKVISSSPGDLEPVFTAMLQSATLLCEASFGSMQLREGEGFRRVVMHNAPAELLEFHRKSPVVDMAKAKSLVRTMTTKQVVQVLDLQVDEPETPLAKYAGARTLVAVPLLKENEVIGVFGLVRREVRPFSDKQIELVANFAAQAVIAIENARLLNDLREALLQQTATSEVLSVISSSPSNLHPVFQTMLANATRLCDATFGLLLLYEGNWQFRVVAMSNAPPAFAELREREPVFEVSPQTGLGRAVATKDVVHIADYAEEAIYARQRHPAAVALGELGGARTFLVVPMIKDNEIVGAIAIYRQQVRLFGDKQVELVKNFAAQAVIAIENARLLNELRQRTTDLTEALERQTATSEVLHVISTSSGELEPVFQIMLESAVRICEAKFGALYRFDSNALHLAAQVGASSELAEFRATRGPFQPTPGGILDRVLRTKRVNCVADQTVEPSGPATILGGARSAACVPMLKDDALIGVIAIYRQEIRPFTDKQIELVKNFAAQAVIAIENARLLQELRERTDQLAAQSRELAALNQQLEQRVSDQVGEIERMGRLRRFLPPQVADLIVASGSEKQLESHRREITALFCDLRGFTGFSESSDPEDVMALLRDYHAAIGGIIVKYSGTLERYAGDGVMVVFNDPVPVENPALQAVLMALEMRDAIGAMTDRWRRLGHDIGFGIGIAHGFATLGTIGFEGRFDYAAIGTVSNVASRLCDEAKTGQILISPRVLMKVEDAMTVEPVGEFALKGLRRPMIAYNVVASSVSRLN